MFERARRLLQLRGGRDLFVLFALTVLTPGLLLVAVGVRAFRQERRLITQQLRDRVDRAADLAVGGLELELRDWRAALARVASSPAVGSTMLPASIAAAFEDPGVAALVIERRGEHIVWPESQLLYRPATLGGAQPRQQVPRAVAEAELLEIRDRNFTQAIRAYEQLRSQVPPADRAEVLLRLARTYRKAGREADARVVFSAMTSTSDVVGALPADLIAKYETQSPDLYRELVEGRWLLDATRYAFYAVAARSWCASADGLGATEESKRELTEAVDDVLAGRRPAAFLVWLSDGAGEGPTSARMVLRKSWLSSRVWPAVFARAPRDGFNVSVADGSADSLFQTAAPAGSSPSELMTVRTLAEDIGGWRLRMWPRDPHALGADLERRQSVYFVMLVLVTASLGFGSYLTTRVVRKELEIARLKSDFVATVSHEFRSPLTGIRQLGELLLRDRVPNESRRHEYYERITRESDRLARLVENLLDFSRMEEGRKRYRFERIDAASWLRSVIAAVEPRYASRGVAIQTAIPDDLPVVLADREALACAVENLLDNAAKYSPGRDRVWLAAESSNGHVTIRVRDEGVGIADADRRQIFDKFYRGGAEITRDVKGAGLGLSLVRHIVDAHGGTVGCETRLGEGSTFEIHLPSDGARRL